MADNPATWKIDHQCPQCGAPVSLEETDHLLTCPYCRTKLYIAARDCLRFCLPPDGAATEGDILYVPYWRLKGLSYTIGDTEITYRHIDASLLAAGIEGPPSSLGLRPQALKLRYAYTVHNGRFCKPHIAAPDLIRRMAATDSAGIHQVLIGEQVSMIYAPMYIDGGNLCDAILRRPVSAWGMDGLGALLEDNKAHPDWQIQFVGTLCPSCGWNLEGEKDALVLVCRNCTTLWACPGNSLEKVEFAVLPGREEQVTYLPYWRVKVRLAGVELQTEADLIRLANLPRAITTASEKAPFYFWIPAFKINPAVFLRWMRQMTCFQPPAGGDSPRLLKEASLYPVNLGWGEAVDAVMVTLGSLIADKRKLGTILPGVRITPLESLLVYHPFVIRKRELIHETLNLTIDRQALAFSSQL